MTKHSKILTLFLAFSFILSLSSVAQQSEEKVVCPVSGHEIKKSEAKIIYDYEGKTYYFCCEKCKEAFIENPEKYTQKKAEAKTFYTCPMHPEVMSDKPGKCPKCGMKLEERMMPKEKMMYKEHMHAYMHKKAEVKTCCPMMGMMSWEEIEMNVENIEGGVAVKITSMNAETVKKIQEMSAKMKEMCCQKEVKKVKTCKKQVKEEEVK